MSKRKGTFETLEDVLDEVDPSIIRYIMVSKKNDLPMDFDLEKIKQTTKENEIFYIQ
jgi:arginyl-tRNA synthetase